MTTRRLSYVCDDCGTNYETRADADRCGSCRLNIESTNGDHAHQKAKLLLDDARFFYSENTIAADRFLVLLENVIAQENAAFDAKGKQS